MKLLTAIVRPEVLGDIQARLQPQEACLLSICQATVMPADPDRRIVFRGATKPVQPARLRLEILVEDDCVDEVIDAIAESGAADVGDQRTDGAIFVLPLADCVGIGGRRRKELAAGV